MTNKQPDDEVSLKTIEEVRQQLELHYVPVFNWYKAFRIVWALVCFMFTIVEFKLNNSIGGSIGATFFIMSLLGVPVSGQLDAASQGRLARWLSSQREDS